MYTLANRYLKREFQVSNEKLLKAQLTNLLNNETNQLANLFELQLQAPTGEVITIDDQTFPLVEVIETQANQLGLRFAGQVEENHELVLTYWVTLPAEAKQAFSRLEIEADVELQNYQLNYLELEQVQTPLEKIVYQIPKDYRIPDEPYLFLASEFLLGQPIFLEGFYYGHEFPASDNYVEENEAGLVHLRYYSGQTLAAWQEQQERHLWQTVVGVTESRDLAGMRQEFFQYVATFARPKKLRLQYNSWYEAFMGITEERFLELSQNMHEASEKYQLPAFDAYVLDDGWNNYNDPEFTGIDTFRSGNTYNQSGFWEFNDKFPNKCYQINDYLKSIGTTLGMWFGPQGGYELQDTFAEYLEKVGSGTVNRNAALGRAIDVNHPTYLRKTKEMLLDFQREFELSYWKFDGFASRPCRREDCGHLTGGPHERFYTTSLWENWIDILEALREQTPDIFINGTCYVNPSPWFLKYFDTIWLQNSEDWEKDQNGLGSMADQMITGRDRIYYTKTFVEGVQLPFAHFYNHEPIYGDAVKMEMTDAEFEKYLLGNVARGPMFWELHFSPSKLNDAKWQSLRNVLQGLQENFAEINDTHMYLINGDFDHGYGYWSQNAEGTAGFLYVRNPSAEARNYDLTKELALFDQNVTFQPVYGGADTTNFADLAVEALGLQIYKWSK